jgi:DMSO/TMAO reductase YedYZ molybdopterin-dependent catalytic subunit
MTRPHLAPSTFFRRIPLAPHALTQPITPVADAIVLCHVGVPRIDAAGWTLTIDGLVSRPARIGFADLLRFRKHVFTSFHECAGSPLAPAEPTRRICNLRWGGAKLIDILDGCGVDPGATYLWSYGADYGEFSGEVIDSYLKDLPLQRLLDDVLVAYEMNGQPLPPENGFPARLVVPGFYGTNSVKWLTRLTLTDRRASGAFTTRWYNDPVADEAGHATGETRPVWAVAPESVIVSPAPDEVLRPGREYRIWGWGWSDPGVTTVDVSTDGGSTWRPAAVEARVERGWQKFSLAWQPERRGTCVLQSRAGNADGQVQPASGARNAIHSVRVMVD